MVDPIHEIKDVRDAWSATTKTNAQLIAAVAGKRIVIDKIYVSANTATLISFSEATSTAVGPGFYLAANEDAKIEQLQLRCSVGVKFNYTVVTSSTGVIYIQYHLESAKSDNL